MSRDEWVVTREHVGIRDPWGLTWWIPGSDRGLSQMGSLVALSKTLRRPSKIVFFNPYYYPVLNCKIKNVFFGKKVRTSENTATQLKAHTGRCIFRHFRQKSQK